MKKQVYRGVAAWVCLVVALLASTAAPAYAQRGGGRGSRGGGSMGGAGGAWHGGGGGWHGGGGGWNGGWRGGGWYGGGWRGWWGGGWRWWGPGVFIGGGLAAPYWGYPYGYPYGYAYPYPYGYPAYSQPVVVEPSPQTYIQQDAQAQQYWYYCQSPQGYYPYVRECPGGWQQVSPQPPPPTR